MFADDWADLVEDVRAPDRAVWFASSFLQGVAKRFAYIAGHFFQALGFQATLICSRRETLSGL